MTTRHHQDGDAGSPRALAARRAALPVALVAVWLGGCLSTPQWAGASGDGGQVDGGVSRGDGGRADAGGGCIGKHDYVQVAVGAEHTCAIDGNGAIWCWGNGDSGRLGDGTSTDSGKPVQVAASFHATAITAGFDQSCAVDKSSQAWCWGDNGDGEITGKAGSRASPIPIKTSSGAAISFTDISAGVELTCGVSTAGRVWCWGANDHNQAGATSGDQVDVPNKVQGISSAVGVTAGDAVACAWTTSGDAYCWGEGENGKLGPLGNGDTATPVHVDGVSGVKKLAAAAHVCAVTGKGEVWCWGSADHGQLGSDVGSSSDTPVLVPGVSGAVDVAVGTDHSCAATSSGKLWCWGRDNDGEVGPGIGSTLRPTAITTGASVRQVSAGTSDTCFVTDAGGLACLGSNSVGQLGVGDAVLRTTPAKVDLGAVQPVSVVAGGDHTCVVDTMGTMWCFGANDFGQLGDGTKTVSSQPVKVQRISAVDPTHIAAGTSFSCGYGIASGDAQRSLECWGHNNHDQLGDGSGDTQTRAVKVNLNTSQNFVADAAGDQHAVALLTGQVFEWGDGISGVQQVSGSQTSSLDLVAAGAAFGCAADPTTGAGAFCWGDGSDGELGTGMNQTSTGMLAVNLGSAPLVTGLAAGSKHACAISHRTGTMPALYCWGAGGSGQLGDGSTNSSSTPRPVSSKVQVPVMAVDAGGETTCAIDGTGALYCWGANARGEVGDGSTNATDTPVKVNGIYAGSKQISVGADHTCAIDKSGNLWCWGSDRDGELGSGRDIDFTSPTAPAGACF